MDKANRIRVAGLLAAVATVANALVSAQLDGGGPGRQPAPPDIAQEWRLDNNERDTFGQAPLGDYTGVPFNDAGRMRSDTTPESIWGTLGYQCRPHASPHQWRGLGGARILKEQDPLTRDVNVYHIQFMRSLDRPIFMDRRAASAGLRAAHLDRLFDRRVDRQHAEDHDHAPEGRVPPARRPADLRHVLDDGVPHEARRRS